MKLLDVFAKLTLPQALVVVALVGAAVFAIHADKVDPLLRVLAAIAGLGAGVAGLFMSPPKAPPAPPSEGP